MNKCIYGFLWIACFLWQTAAAQNSISQAGQTSLNGEWDFRIDPNNEGERENWFGEAFKTTGWDRLPVPGNWDLRNEYAHYTGKAWYRRTFPVAADQKGKTLLLHFEAVYHDCTVWLNGRKLGENHSGFLPFEFDVSALVNYGGENTLVVCADNTFKRGAIWNWGGIRRSVSLQTYNGVRLVRQHITPTINLTAGTASVAIRLFLQNHTQTEQKVQGEVTVTDKNMVRKTVPFATTLPAQATGEVLVKTTLAKNEAHWWHFDDPYLYESQVRLTSPVSEAGVSRFGLRKIEVDNRNYTLKLNGESIRPMGFNLVSDDRTTGNTLPLWRIKEDIDLLKLLGCNMTRLSHLILPEEMMDYLDERGMLVVSEIPLWGFDPLADPANPMPKDWLRRMIAQQYNHPSVIAWSVGNEIGDYPTTMKYVEAATAHVRTLDSTRLAVAVSHTADRSPDFIQFSDIGLINKYGKNLGPPTDLQHKLHPEKVLFYSEYGVGQIGEGLDATINAKSLLDSIRNRPFLVGGSLWTFNDYRSSFFGTKEFSENRPWGVVDVFRRKKQAWFAFRKEQSPVREMTVNFRTPASATATFVPRNVLDLPAFTLRNYRLVWKISDEKGNIKQGGFQPLPTVHPGEAAFTRSFQWTATNAFALKVELHTPQSEAVFDTTVFFQKPLPAKILQVVGGRSHLNGNRGNSGMMRVYIEHTPTATAYKVRYGTGDLTQETLPTIENFIDIPGLAFGQTYRIALVSINGAGETLSEVQSVTVEDKNMAPPAIRYVEPADGGFFVGYATEDDDFLFRVQYTTKPGDYANATVIQSTTPGVLFVPNLKNGQPYYFRVQRFKDNNAESVWTSERTVTPDGGQRLPPPVLQGVIRSKKEVLICFEPVKKATGYVIEYRTDSGKDWTRVAFNTAQVGHANLLLPDSNRKHRFRIASLNKYGISEFSDVFIP